MSRRIVRPGQKMFNRSSLKEIDPQLAAAIAKEERRQREKIELIASENFVSRAVLEAQGSVLTNKYAEGYPGQRWYGGCEHVDVIEELARQRACELFGAQHANVQPHAGAPANTAVYLALLKPGDVVLGMDLAHGGHLTHGSPVNISGQLYSFYAYGVERETGLINMEEVRKIARRRAPKMIVAGASAYPRKIDFAAFGEIAREVGACLMVDMAHIAGLVAAGLHENPVPHAPVVTSTTHKTLRGPRGGLILCARELARAIDKAIFPGLQGGPLMHIIAAKAVALQEAREKSFVEYQKQVLKNARVMARCLQERGYKLVSDGTDNHLLLLDLRNKKITGREAADILDEVGITVNKNAVPYDDQNPVVTSGIRLGTPAITTRGMKEEEVELIAELIDRVLEGRQDPVVLAEVKSRVKDLCAAFPIFRD